MPESSTTSIASSGSATGSDTGTVSGGQSPNPPGTEAVQTSTSTDKGANPLAAPVNPGFDYTTWDGEIDSLPDPIRTVVTKKQKDLEAGYTPKFQKLAEERAAFETERERQQRDWQAKQTQYDAYEAIFDGSDDPRLATLTAERDEWQTKHDAVSTDWKAKHEAALAQIDALHKDSDRQAVMRVKQAHPELVTDPAKKEAFLNYTDKGWDIERAAELVSLPDEVVLFATQVALEGVPQHYAIELARQRANQKTGPRQPRVAAQITTGVNGEGSPSQVKIQDLSGLSRKDRYRAVAERYADQLRKADQ